MKNIKKIGKAVAGSALLVGATLAGAASFAAAQSGSSGNTLGDYPAPYVGEDGNVDASIVVGESAKTVDVVGAIDIAGSLSQAAFTSETVSAGSGAASSWSATNGVTLDTRNDQLYFRDRLDTVRDTLTEDQLSTLSETTFRDDDGDETDIEYFLYPGPQQTEFGKPDDRNNKDPVFHVENPSSPGPNSHLFKLQANMEEAIAFNASDVEDEEIQLFGNTYTVSTDTTADELVLFGSQEEYDIETGSSKTITINGNEHTFEVVAVTGPNTVAFRVDGQLREEQEDNKFTVDGQEVRITDVIQTNSDQSKGVATFGLGSQELRLQPNSKIEDGEGNDVDGTYVEFNGGEGTSADPVADLSSITVYVGAQNDDHEYLMAGESYSHPAFEDFKFHLGGLNPDASSADKESVNRFGFSTSGDDTATVSMTAQGGDEATLEYAHTEDTTSTGTLSLADDDNDAINVVEGAATTEDEYLTTDAGDFSHVWEVTNIDPDSQNPSSGDEATIDLQDAVSGDQVTVDIDYDTSISGVEYAGTEVIDGQTHYVWVDTKDTSKSSDDVVKMTYGSGAGFADTGDTSIYAAQDAQGQAAVSLQAERTVNQSSGTVQTYVLPSTESTDERTVTLEVNSTADFVSSSSTGVSTSVDSSSAGAEVANVTVNGGATYQFTEDNSAGTVSFNPITPAGASVNGPSVAVIEPEDDNDNEQVYHVTNSVDTQDEEVDVNKPVYTGMTRQTQSLESNDDVTVGYDLFGAYTAYDSDGQGSLDIHVPNGQATVGAAVTGMDGSLSSSGSAGSVQTMTPAGWGDVGALDSDSNIGQLKNNRNLILVGGPAVNSLVQELANSGDTWSASKYSQGQAIVQQIDNAFSQGNDALVVAGTTGADTREAANFLANYESNQDRMAGKDQVTLTTAQSTQ